MTVTRVRRGRRPEHVLKMARRGELCTICTEKTRHPLFSVADLCLRCAALRKEQITAAGIAAAKARKEERYTARVARAAHARKALLEMRRQGIPVGKKAVGRYLCPKKSKSDNKSTAYYLKPVIKDLEARKIKHLRTIKRHQDCVAALDNTIKILTRGSK